MMLQTRSQASARADLSRKKPITHARLEQAAKAATERVKHKLAVALRIPVEAIPVDCRFKYTEDDDAKLHSLMRASFFWSTLLGSLDCWNLVCRALHGSGLKKYTVGREGPVGRRLLPGGRYRTQARAGHA